MAEAVGIASAAVAFLDFSIKVGVTAKTMHDAADGQIEKDKNVELLTKSIDNLAQKLQGSKPALEMTPEEAEIHKIAGRCHEMAKKLLAILSARKSRTKSAWGAVKEAFKAVWREKEVKETLKELQDTRDMLCWLQSSLRLESLHNDMQKLKLSAKSDRVAFTYLNQRLNHESETILTCSANTEGLQDFLRRHNTSEAAILKSLQTDFLEALKFPEMDRFYDDLEPYEGTLEWLLDEDDATDDGSSEDELSDEQLDAREQLRAWMSEKSGLFCISGKPGAGKSTTMKFLCRHPTTLSRLKSWAGAKRLCFGRFFFRKIGTTVEKSLHGLIRTVLYTMLESCPGLIAVVFPHKWDQLKRNPAQCTISFGKEEIETGFQKLVRDGTVLFKDYHVTLFIDGLDEFEPPKSKPVSILADMLEAWLKTGAENLKICVSARPETFTGPLYRHRPNFQLQDLTRCDMVLVTRSRLSNHPRFLELVSERKRKRVIDAIVRSSEGVFLWLGLMVTQLEDGLFSGCTVKELVDSIESYPRDIDEFFTAILDRVNDGERGYVYRLLDFVASSPSIESFHLRAFDLYEREDFPDAERFYNIVKLHPVGDEEYERDMQAVLQRVLRRCKGLIEAVPESNVFGNLLDYAAEHPMNRKIKLIHRTLKDFMDKRKHTWDEHLAVSSWLKPYCYSYLALDSDNDTHCQLRDEVANEVEWMTYHFTSRIELAPGWFISFLHQVDRVATARCFAHNDPVPEKGSASPECRDREPAELEFVKDIAAKVGLHEYLPALYPPSAAHAHTNDLARRASTARSMLETMFPWLWGYDGYDIPLVRYSQTLKVILADNYGPLIEPVDLGAKLWTHGFCTHGTDPTERDGFYQPAWMLVVEQLFPVRYLDRVKAILSVEMQTTIPVDIDCRCYLIIGRSTYYGKYKLPAGVTMRPYWLEWGGFQTPPQMISTGRVGVDVLTFLSSRVALFETETGCHVMAAHHLPVWRELQVGRTGKSTTKLRDLLRDGSDTAKSYCPIGKFKLSRGGHKYECAMLEEVNGYWSAKNRVSIGWDYLVPA